MSEWDKMVAGEAYDPRDQYLTEARTRARMLLQQFNDSSPADLTLRDELLGRLVGAAGERLWIEPPFYCDYGTNMRVGHDVFFNFDCVVLDVAPVTIGDWAFIGPGVHIYTAAHYMEAQARRRDLEFGRSVQIGDDVWIGGGVLILPGVRVGSRTVIGAGAVVTRDLPHDVFAAGNPCRVIKRF